MCALHENCMPSNQNHIKDHALLNMALKHSLNCVSDHIQSDCGSGNIKVSKPCDELTSATSSVNYNSDSHNICDKAQNPNKKSLYMSKACKYSFIASDYTSAEGQKLLSIKVYQKPPETDDVSVSKGKSFLSKRSISEYFLSKNNGMDKDAQSEKGKENNLLKSWQRTFFKPQVLIPHPVEETPNCDNTNTHFLQDGNDATHKNNYLKMQEVSNVLDSGPSVSATTHECGEEKNMPPGLLYNLNPNVNFRVFDIESISDSGEPCDSVSVENNAHFGLDDAWFIPSARHTFSGADISGSASAAQLSIASSFGDSSLPTCKICHTAAKAEDPLISPCRCTGTLRYIHCGCLMKWLEICNKRSRKPPTCELCKYQFHWHKKFKVN